MNTDRDWLEDVEFENGKYINLCRTCKRSFIGHKRRTHCKKCVYAYGIKQEKESERPTE